MALLSRRALLALMSGVGVIVAGGGFALAHGPESLIRRIMTRRFPEVRMSEESFAALTSDLLQARFQTFGRRMAVEGIARAVSLAGFDTFTKWGRTAEPFQQLERQVVTYFILGSDFMDVKDASRDIVTYSGTPVVCPNRFAQYDS
jgi:hypothetical protein